MGISVQSRHNTVYWSCTHPIHKGNPRAGNTLENEDRCAARLSVFQFSSPLFEVRCLAWHMSTSYLARYPGVPVALGVSQAMSISRKPMPRRAELQLCYCIRFRPSRGRRIYCIRATGWDEQHRLHGFNGLMFRRLSDAQR